MRDCCGWRAQASALRDENTRLKERLRVMEEELSRMHRVA